ncbi:MAG: OmpA family protein [Prevotella sp.]|nr:OmpA family protein [Candidatus Prevotella equi]
MKKIAMFIAAAAIAVSASAQKTVVTSSKAGDNWYIGVNAGAQSDKSFEKYAPTLAVRAGKNFTTVFGVAFEGEAGFNTHTVECRPYANILTNVDVNVLGTANLMNLFAGYKGEPRAFEVTALGGFGWGHGFVANLSDKALNALTSKVALDFAYNLGSDKQWQIYIEPSVNFALAYNELMPAADIQYDINRAKFGLKAGFNYKFGNSNGKHNFAIEQLRDQAEIDALNAKINEAQAAADAAKKAVAAKDAKIAELQKALTECQNKPAPAPVVEKKAANLQPSVVFGQGKSVVEKSQMANVNMIANYMKQHPEAKVKISGYASPEGNAELNQKLSEKRAEAVKNILVKQYKIKADRLETEGLGATDKLFDEVEFNRVALFNDTNK